MTPTSLELGEIGVEAELRLGLREGDIVMVIDGRQIVGELH